MLLRRLEVDEKKTKDQHQEKTLLHPLRQPPLSHPLPPSLPPSLRYRVPIPPPVKVLQQ